MKTNQKLLLILSLSIVVLFGFWNLKQKNVNTSTVNQRVVQEFKAALIITDGKENPSFDISQYVGRTALEATKSVVKDNIKMSGTGDKAFITGINRRDADTKKREFWEFLVNGKQAEVGAGTYTIQNFDTISWKISTY